MQDVNGVNLWGGRDVRARSGLPVARRPCPDRARRVRRGRARPDPQARLRWCDTTRQTLLDEDRTMSAAAVDASLVAARGVHVDQPDRRRRCDSAAPPPTAAPVTLATAASSGAAPRRDPRRLQPRTRTVEADVNGSAAAWVALAGPAYTVVFTGLGEGDRWFVRLREYPGVCVALAFAEVRSIEPGDSLRREHEMRISDGGLAG